MAVGFDTSAYTTSAAVMDLGYRLLRDLRRPLAVKPGSRGLRQEEAVFQHLKALPELAAEAFGGLGSRRAIAVAASTAPRPAEGSYMPVFLVGHGFAKACAPASGAQLFATSHQEGHIAAALWSLLPGAEDGMSGSPLWLEGLPARFLAVHLSGGTTEVVLVDISGGSQPGLDLPRDRRSPAWFASCGAHVLDALATMRVGVLGRTLDISAGQVIDRVGVAMGMGFPAGPALSALAAQGTPGAVRIPSSVKGCDANFSGMENAALKALDGGAEKADVALGVLDAVARTVSRMILAASDESGADAVLVAGGVSASLPLRECLEARLSARRKGIRVAFANPKYGSDSAVGVAALAVAHARASGEM